MRPIENQKLFSAFANRETLQDVQRRRVQHARSIASRPVEGKAGGSTRFTIALLVGTPTAVRAAERPQCQTPAIVGRQTMRSRRRSITVRGARLGGLHRRRTQLRWKSSIVRIKITQNKILVNERMPIANSLLI